MRWSNPGDDEEEEQRIASSSLVKCANKSHNCFPCTPPHHPPLLPLPYETKSYLRPKPKQRNFHFQFS